MSEESYYKKWYEDNKMRLSARRKRKYREDKAYRNGCRSRARRYYRTNVKRMIPADRLQIRAADGRRFFTIGRIARAIGRTIQTTRGYHRRGIIPNPQYSDRRGWRLFTVRQMNLMVEGFKYFDRGHFKTLKDLSEYLHERWSGGEE